MPAAVIGGLIAAGGAFGAAEIQRRSANNAVKQQQASADKALAASQAVYTQAREDYAPYRATGQQALPQLSAYANAPVVQRGPGPTGYQPGYQPGMTLGGMTNGMSAPSDGRVMLESPTGARKLVPADQVAGYLAKGARRV